MHLSKSNEALRRLDTGLRGLGFPVDVSRSLELGHLDVVGDVLGSLLHIGDLLGRKGASRGSESCKLVLRHRSGRGSSRVVAEARGELAALLPSVFGNNTPVGFTHSLDGRSNGVVPALLQRRGEGRRRVVRRDRAGERRRGLLLRERGGDELGRSAEPAGWSA